MDLDPNQENGLDWLMAIHRERGGDAAVVPVFDVASKAAWDLWVIVPVPVARRAPGATAPSSLRGQNDGVL